MLCRHVRAMTRAWYFAAPFKPLAKRGGEKYRPLVFTDRGIFSLNFGKWGVQKNTSFLFAYRLPTVFCFLLFAYHLGS